MRLEYFQLVDRVVDIDMAARAIRAEADIPATSTVFEGHFPGHPLMPGVLLLEAMAQTSGWLMVAMSKFERMAFLAAAKQAKFRQFVSPGARLSIVAKLVHDGSGYAITEAAIEVAGKTVASAEITLRLLPFANEHFLGMMRQRAAEIGLATGAAVDG